jgi:glycogen synthase
MTNSISRPLRILYAAGPGDVLGTYRHWSEGQDDPSQVGITYSGQFFDVCRSIGAKGYVLSYCSKKAFLQDSQFTIEHRPKLFPNASGILHHLREVWYGLRLVATALQWRADVVIAATGTTHWFVLALLHYLGIKVIPSLHCVLWRQYVPQTKVEKLLIKLNAYLFNRSTAILAVSNTISGQVKQTIDSRQAKVQGAVLDFLPVYRGKEFRDVAPPNLTKLPFRVVFIGRVEENKGVFDLLEVAKQLAAQGRRDIQFDICGNGSLLESLRFEIQQAGLEQTVICHGYCNKDKVHQVLSQSHAVIVPTKTSFAEGFCKVVAEGVLAGRPVVTSKVCPALAYARPGVVEASPDNVADYTNALLKLRDDVQFYQQKRQGCFKVQAQFYDFSRSWGATLKSVLVKLQGAPVAAKESYAVLSSRT